jgi:predicted amino acid dehydrogenase
MCIDISLETEKMRPGNIPADSATPYTSDRQISRLAVRVAGNFDPFVIGDAHIVSKTGQATYREFIIAARTAAELAQVSYMVEIIILAPERRFEDASLGIDLDVNNVAEMIWLANGHGFRPAPIHSSYRSPQRLSMAIAT